MSPAHNPARVLFNRQMNIVPKGFKGMNIANVDGAKITAIPLIKPKKAPQNGPYNIAPMAIGIKHKLMETGPKVIKLPNICKTISIAVKKPVAAIFLVEKNVFFFPK